MERGMRTDKGIQGGGDTLLPPICNGLRNRMFCSCLYLIGVILLHVDFFVYLCTANQ